MILFGNNNGKIGLYYQLMNTNNTLLNCYLKTYNLLNKPTIQTFDFQGSCNYGYY